MEHARRYRLAWAFPEAQSDSLSQTVKYKPAQFAGGRGGRGSDLISGEPCVVDAVVGNAFSAFVPCGRKICGEDADFPE